MFVNDRIVSIMHGQDSDHLCTFIPLVDGVSLMITTTLKQTNIMIFDLNVDYFKGYLFLDISFKLTMFVMRTLRHKLSLFMDTLCLYLLLDHSYMPYFHLVKSISNFKVHFINTQYYQTQTKIVTYNVLYFKRPNSTPRATVDQY